MHVEVDLDWEVVELVLEFQEFEMGLGLELALGRERDFYFYQEHICTPNPI